MKRADEYRVQRRIFKAWLSRSHAVRDDAPLISVAVSVYRLHRLLLHRVPGVWYVLLCLSLTRASGSHSLQLPGLAVETGVPRAVVFRPPLCVEEKAERVAAQTASTRSRAVLVGCRLALISSLKRWAHAAAGVSKGKGADWRLKRVSQNVLDRGASRSRNAV